MITTDLTPKMIVAELDKYIVGQNGAKKMVAIALRNRIRRMKLEEDLRKEIIPKNILMIGPTGVGKTEIARRLAEITNSPFIKVEATKFTEVGYVGKNVDSMVRDLVDVSVNLVRTEMTKEVEEKAKIMVDERIADLIVPGRKNENNPNAFMEAFGNIFGGNFNPQQYQQQQQQNQNQNNYNENEVRTKRQETLYKVKSGELDHVEIEVELDDESKPMFAGMGSEFEDMGMQLGEMFSNVMPKKKKVKKIKVGEAKKLLLPIESDKLIDKDKLISDALERAQNKGIIFIDEIDKIVAKGSSSGPDVSREGVQRDLLPIIEGTTIMTKYGPVKSDYILFIAAGAFHVSKPSELIPELQGRLPIRVELESLTEEDFERILKEPKNALVKQYRALLETDGVELEFTEDGIKELAHIAFSLNEKVENIGARRLYTVVEKVLEEVSFHAPASDNWKVLINSEYVSSRLNNLVQDQNLREFVL